MKRFAALVVALFSAVVFAQDLPKIAVYVTGDVSGDVKKALGTKMLAELVNSGRYIGIERSDNFLAEIDKEQVKQRSGAIDDKQISKVGMQFGVKYVCIADITPALGAFQVSARVVDVETAQVPFIGESNSELKTLDDLASVSVQVVKKMFGGGIDEWKSEQAVATQRTDAPKYSGSDSNGMKTSVGYYALKYQIPVGTPISWGGVHLEFGSIPWDDVSFGMDLSFGISDSDKNENTMIGFGVILSKAYNLYDKLQIVYGGSYGLFVLVEEQRDSLTRSKLNMDFFATFIKLRWNYIELTYRGLLGFNEKGYYNNGNYISESEERFGWNNHQLMLGLYLTTTPKPTSKKTGTLFKRNDANVVSYVAPRYQIPLGTPVRWGGINFEVGGILENGVFFGTDVSGLESIKLGEYTDGDCSFFGLGLSVGKIYDIGNGLQFVYGGSGGYWYGSDDKSNDDYRKITHDFLAPFIKLRWNFIEFTYRGFLGVYEKRSDVEDEYIKGRVGFGLNNNQLMLGLYFETPKRDR